MTFLQHTPEDAEILRRTDPRFSSWSGDHHDGCVIAAHENMCASGKYPPDVMRHCLAAQGYNGQEWLDLMDELAGRVSA